MNRAEFEHLVGIDEAADVIEGERTADGFIAAALSGAVTAGDELHRALSRLLGYGERDRRLIGFCRRLQKHLEHARR